MTLVISQDGWCLALCNLEPLLCNLRLWFGSFSIIDVFISDIFYLNPDMSSPISNSKENVAATTSIIDLTVILFNFNWVQFIF